MSLHPDFTEGEARMEDNQQVMVTQSNLEPDPMSRDSSVSTPASMAPNFSHTQPGVSALAGSGSATDSSQPR
jgi:hypothetical protein